MNICMHTPNTQSALCYRSAMDVLRRCRLVRDDRLSSKARRVAYGALARKISKFGSPIRAIPSKRPRPRVTNAKKGGT